MSPKTLKVNQVAPPKPPLTMRVEKYMQYLAYAVPHNWKKRSVASAVLVLTLLTAWWTYDVRIPFLEAQHAEVLNPETLAQNISDLKAELAGISSEKSADAINQINQRIVHGYAGLSALIENTQAQAKRHHLLFNYKLEQPTPSGFRYIQDVSVMKLSIRLVPMPSASQAKIWRNILAQVRGMVAHKAVFQLLGAQVISNTKQVQEVVLDLQIYVQFSADNHGHVL